MKYKYVHIYIHIYIYLYVYNICIYIHKDRKIDNRNKKVFSICIYFSYHFSHP